ncbi:MAG: hypothetical protein H6745_16680 [Deltaproteobacteria bacterium]|nr:hypothetical protein [Deltaproteobacteria bacterium]
MWQVAGGTPTIVLDDGGRSAGRDDRALGWDPAGPAFAPSAHLVVRGATRLVMATALVVKDLTLEGEAVLTHLETTPSLSAGLVVNAEHVTIGADAAIDVSGRGYVGDCHGFGCASGGYTVGNVATHGAAQFRGGAHGGAGGSGAADAVHGEPLAPLDLGSGGGYGAGQSEYGGDGGGRVRLVAARLDLEGAIRANGDPGSGAGQGNGGGGAGGSVWLTVETLAGEGVIEAQGGSTPRGAGGGGGRVAVEYDALDATDPLAIEAISAWGGEGATVALGGGPGTIAFARAGQTATLWVDNGGRAHVVEAAPWPEIGARVVVADLGGGVSVGGNPWFPDTLSGLDARFDAGGERFTVTSNDRGTLGFDPADGATSAVATAGARFHGVRALPVDLVLSGAARVALADEVTVTSLAIDDGAVLTHAATPPGGAEPGLVVTATGAVDVGAGGAIDVSGRGYVGDCGPGAGAAAPGSRSGTRARAARAASRAARTRVSALGPRRARPTATRSRRSSSARAAATGRARARPVARAVGACASRPRR